MYTAIAFKVGSLRTDAAIYRCKGPLADIVLFTERAAAATTAGHAIGVLHVAWTILNRIYAARDRQKQICNRVCIQVFISMCTL